METRVRVFRTTRRGPLRAPLGDLTGDLTGDLLRKAARGERARARASAEWRELHGNRRAEAASIAERHGKPQRHGKLPGFYLSHHCRPGMPDRPQRPAQAGACIYLYSPVFGNPFSEQLTFDLKR